MCKYTDFYYLMDQVHAGKVKRPWRNVSRRKFKKYGHVSLDYDELFILSTNAKVGDIYHEHGENHRISEIRKIGAPWAPMWIDVKNPKARIRFARKAMVKMAGFIVNEMNCSTCGCGHLSLPVSIEEAAETELMSCLAYFDTDRLRELDKKKGRYRSESEFLERFEGDFEMRNDPGFALYVDWTKRVVRIYDEDGPLTIVDEDGVLLESYRETSSDIWKMCWATWEDV